MSPRARHGMPSAGSQDHNQGIQRHMLRDMPLTSNAPFSSPMVDDIVPQHFSLSSNGPYGRSRHDQGAWSASDRSYFSEHDDYNTLPQSTRGGYTINPVDSVYSQAMMMPSTGYETVNVFSVATTNLYNPVETVSYGRHQVFNDQDMTPDSMVQLELDEYDGCLSQSAAHFPTNLTGTRCAWNSGLPSPPMENSRHAEPFVDQDCILPAPALASDRRNRHDVAMTDDVDMSMYQDPATMPYQRQSGSRHTAVQPRPLRSASERKESVSPGSDQTDFRNSKENCHGTRKPRSDQLYDAKPWADGLYHCPFANREYCSHKPTKQKCIYDKNLDSHLKPYKCKDRDCQETSFSSNACLFRHEREAHGLHGHNPHLCRWPNCERAQPGNGFPRKWNLGDHMKRVHGYDMAKEGSSDDRHGNSDSSKRRRGPANPAGVNMRRSTSSKDKALAASASYVRDDVHVVSVSKHKPRPAYASYRTQGCNTVDGYQVSMAMPYDNVVYTQYSRHSQPYVATY